MGVSIKILHGFLSKKGMKSIFPNWNDPEQGTFAPPLCGGRRQIPASIPSSIA
jgi:hypothetical protein